MTFDATSGTRGGRVPRGAFMRWFNRRMAKRIRGKGGRMLGQHSLLLITVGAKSGEPREVPLARFAAPNGGWFVVASANGAQRNPSWYHNLAAHPDQARIVMDGTETAVIATQLHGDEREHAWQQVIAEQPRFAKYAAKTDRAIPIIRLTPKTTPA